MDTDDGQFAGSTAIVHFLEARFPEVPLLPKEPYALGRVLWFSEFAKEIFRYDMTDIPELNDEQMKKAIPAQLRNRRDPSRRARATSTDVSRAPERQSTRRYARLADNTMLEVLRPSSASQRQAGD